MVQSPLPLFFVIVWFSFSLSNRCVLLCHKLSSYAMACALEPIHAQKGSCSVSPFCSFLISSKKSEDVESSWTRNENPEFGENTTHHYLHWILWAIKAWRSISHIFPTWPFVLLPLSRKVGTRRVPCPKYVGTITRSFRQNPTTLLLSSCFQGFTKRPSTNNHCKQ